MAASNPYIPSNDSPPHNPKDMQMPFPTACMYTSDPYIGYQPPVISLHDVNPTQDGTSTMVRRFDVIIRGLTKKKSEHD